MIRPEPSPSADDANGDAGIETIIKNEIKTEATIDTYAADEHDVVDSKDGLQSLITSANIKSE